MSVFYKCEENLFRNAEGVEVDMREMDRLVYRSGPFVLTLVVDDRFIDQMLWTLNVGMDHPMSWDKPNARNITLQQLSKVRADIAQAARAGGGVVVFWDSPESFESIYASRPEKSYEQ